MTVTPLYKVVEMHLRERIESGERIAGGRPIEYRVTRSRANRFGYRAEIR